jgi:hypothetical protein
VAEFPKNSPKRNPKKMAGMEAMMRMFARGCAHSSIS